MAAFGAIEPSSNCKPSAWHCRTRDTAATGSCRRDLSHPRAAEDTAGDEPGRDAAPARRRPQPQGLHVAQSRLRLRPARQRGGQAQGQAYRQRAEDHSGRAVQELALAKAGGRKDRNVMLSPETLGLLRQWWKARPSRYDAGTPVAELWLPPGFA